MNTTFDNPKLWTTEELATKFGTTGYAIDAERSKKRLPYCKVGGRVRFTDSHVEKWLDNLSKQD